MSLFRSTNMETKSRQWFFLYVLLHFYFSSSKKHLSIATDTILSGQALSGNQTISSKGGIFELGFFTPGKSQNYYIGIWYKQVSEQTVVWVANREIPLPNKYTSQLKISPDGNLVLIDQLERSIWSTNITSIASNSKIAELLDNGNLVLRDGLNSSAVIWQSFDHPTHTLLPTAWLGRNKITGERQRLTTWKNSEDPAPGMFSFELDPDGSDQLIMQWNRSKVYQKSGVWNGQFFSRLPEMAPGQMFNYRFVEIGNSTYFTYSATDGSNLRRTVMELSGQVRHGIWAESSHQWNYIRIQPTDQCEVYSFCGTFGICANTQPFCSCLHGFEPRSMKDWNSSVWSGGCVRKVHLQCGGNNAFDGEKDGFLMLHNMLLPTRQLLTVNGTKECELSCSSSCSCNAYAYNNGCFVWNGDLMNLQQLFDGDVNGQDLYIRLAASELQSLGPKKRMITKAIISAAVGCASVLGVSMFMIWRFQRRQQAISLDVVQGSLVSFIYKDLQIITKNFSEKLGRGSFGSVFKGSLPDSTPIAVKKLEGLIQGEKQFRAEVSTIGTIQHINLIRLLGFCSQGTHRLLVYDYMPNGSLNSHLFNNNSETLDWKTRYQIALGTARGLAYLHEKCRDCIIHCDIKPENVLLDAVFSPKLADFGMAKLVGREYSRVLTSMRGTIGYLAPEWISGVAITSKADVFSYGMMLFEIISGKRNAEQLGEGESAFFPCLAVRKVADGKVLCLFDCQLKGNADIEELTRASKVACWCIQDNEGDRPSMGHVVQMLEGVIDVSIPPIPWSIKILIGN